MTQPPFAPKPPSAPPGASPAETSAPVSPQLGELEVMAAVGKKRGTPLPLVVGFALGSAVVGLVAGALLFAGSPETPAPTAASAAPAKPKPAPPQPEPKKSTAELAVEGDKAALEQLSSKPRGERTSEEVVALARVAGDAKRKEVAELIHKSELVEDFAKDRGTKKGFFRFSRDRQVAVDTLAMLSKMEGQFGPDYLYWLMSHRLQDDETEELAEALLYSKDVRQNASLALSVILDLRAEKRREEKRCEEVAKLLDTVTAVGDRRVLSHLNSLHSKRGCGEKKTDDCWPCLRKGDKLKEAVRAARGRKSPL